MMSKTIYKIYHIPDFVWSDGTKGKIGATYKLQTRINENLKKSLEPFDNWEVLEEHTCKHKVSDREIELQKEYGYKVDTIPYWKTLLGCGKNRKVISKTMAESGHFARMGKIGGPKSGRIAVETGQLEKMNLEKRKPILQYDKSGNLIKEWGSAKEAAEKLKLRTSGICMVCKGKYKTTGGYVFKYKSQ